MLQILVEKLGIYLSFLIKHFRRFGCSFSSSTENPIPTGTTAITAQANELWVGAIGAWGNTEQTGTSNLPLVADSITNGFEVDYTALIQIL